MCLCPRSDNRNDSCYRSRFRFEPCLALQGATGGCAFLANYMASHSHRVVAYCDPPARHLRVGSVFLVGGMYAGHRIVVLLFGGYLRHHRIWRSSLAESVADAWPNRSEEHT